MNDIDRKALLLDWARDLPSYEQAHGSLKGRNGEASDVMGYCCLGVLAHKMAGEHSDLLRDNGFEVVEEVHSLTVFDSQGDALQDMLPSRLGELLGIEHLMNDLIQANDEYMRTFTEIGAAIESYAISGLDEAITNLTNGTEES